MRLATRAAAGLAVAGTASATYQKIADARDCRRFPPPGLLVDIGGRCLHLVTVGEGSPAVVIIPALADNVLQWLPIAQRAAAGTQVIVYDRAGIGWSDPPPLPERMPGLMAADLYALLHAAQIPPPYILAGHSIGGIIARRFYVQHPDEVAGIALIDSSHEDQTRRFDSAGWWKGTGAYLEVIGRNQARILGARRLASKLSLMPGIEADVAREASQEFAGEARAIILSTRQRRVMVREMLMMIRLRVEPPRLGSVPLAVLTALRRPDDTRLPIWRQMQNELAALSTDSVHVIAPDAGHYAHRDDPELVVSVILDLVNRVNARETEA